MLTIPELELKIAQLCPAIAVSCIDSGLKQNKDKANTNYLAGRLAAHNALTQLGFKQQNPTGQLNTKIEIKKSPAGIPVFPDGYIGSITHSQNIAIAVAAEKQGSYIQNIGIDIETNIARTLKIITRIANEKELHNIPFNGFSKEESSAVLFSAKEAFYKAALNPNFTWSDLQINSVDESNINFLINPEKKDQLSFLPENCTIKVIRINDPIPSIISLVICR